MDNSIHWKTGMDDIIHSKGEMDIYKGEFHVKASGNVKTVFELLSKMGIQGRTHYGTSLLKCLIFSQTGCFVVQQRCANT